jgi:hypothetical protein
MHVLTELGIPAEVMSSVGYGATRLRDNGTTEEAHQRNRRVEFVVETHKAKPVTPPPAPPAAKEAAPVSEPAAPPAAHPAQTEPAAADAAHPPAPPVQAIKPGENLEGSRLSPHSEAGAAHEEVHP